MAPRAVDRFAAATAKANLWKKAQRPVPGEECASRRYTDFRELRLTPPFPSPDETAIRRSSAFNNTAKFWQLRFPHSEMMPPPTLFPTNWVASFVRRVAKGFGNSDAASFDFRTLPESRFRRICSNSNHRIPDSRRKPSPPFSAHAEFAHQPLPAHRFSPWPARHLSPTSGKCTRRRKGDFWMGPSCSQRSHGGWACGGGGVVRACVGGSRNRAYRAAHLVSALYRP